MQNHVINEDNLIQSRTYVIKNNYWNENHENILNNILNNSNKLSREYQKNFLSLRSRLTKYRIPIIIISSMGGFLSLANSGYVPTDYNKWVSLFVGFANLMVSVISLIENFKKIDDTMNKSYISYLNFKKLHDEISVVLKIPQQERDNNGYDIVMNFFKKYELCLNDAPILKKLLKDALDINLNTISLDSDCGISNNVRTNQKERQIIKTINVNELNTDFDIEHGNENENENENDEEV
jgi:hypothetical protein